MKKIIYLSTFLLAFCRLANSQAQFSTLTQNPVKGFVQIWKDGPHKATPTQLLSGITTITYNGTKDTVDFAANRLQTLSITGNDTLYTTNVAAGYEVFLRIKSDGTSRTLGFPSSWTFMSSIPTALAANKTAILHLRSYGTTDANIVAVYSVQP